MLEVKGIDVFYGHIRALRDVSLRVGEGQVVALVGGNGAGKTTTLRSISALMRPVHGEILLDGERIDTLRPEQVVARGVGHLPEGRGIFPTLTVEENLRMGYFTKRRDRDGWNAGIDRVTEMFPRLKERWAQPAGTMSGGEQQMLALGRALLPQPRLLMIDELSLGLAPLVVQQLFAALVDINRSGTTVLLVEQYVNLALKVASHVYVLEKGAVAFEGDAERVRAEGELVRALYLGGRAKEVSKRERSRRSVSA
ncbi:MAG TPA: ABC transporter ATP-binding protein [Actinomycetota bacterium]|nr:ABC transporter ATP-binding protein [Actinomycetota bacterium]